MDQIELAIEHLKLHDTDDISTTARLFNVNRSTLSRRFNGVTNPASMAQQNSRFLNNPQEQELLKYINQLTDKGIPPTVSMVRNFAGDIAGKLPGKCWSQRFCTRHQDKIKSGYLKNLDSQRSKADSAVSYGYFFALLKEKLEKHHVLPCDQYNMDEKGFMLGVMNKQRRIFSKDAFEQGRVIGATHDGNREWITVLATVCADGTWIPPALIYASQAGNI
jgi:hypothetical protein